MNDSNSNARRSTVELLHQHAYGLFELARDLSGKLGLPLCEAIGLLDDTLPGMQQAGEIQYNRAANQICLAAK